MRKKIIGGVEKITDKKFFITSNFQLVKENEIGISTILLAENSVSDTKIALQVKSFSQNKELEELRSSIIQKNIRNNYENYIHGSSTQEENYSVVEILSVLSIECDILASFKAIDNKKYICGDNGLPVRPEKWKITVPNSEELYEIVNFPNSQGDNEENLINLGRIRYGENEIVDKEKMCNMVVDPECIIGHRTALFGMTRTGKSNVSKTIISSIFNLSINTKRTIGQLIFDPQGEYANINEQDFSTSIVAMGKVENDDIDKVVPHLKSREQHLSYVYKIPNQNRTNFEVENDQFRSLSLNFFDEESTPFSWEIIKTFVSAQESNYVKEFCSAVPYVIDTGEELTIKEKAKDKKRAERAYIAYCYLLLKTGFNVPKINGEPKKILFPFSKEIVELLEDDSEEIEIIFNDKTKKYEIPLDENLIFAMDKICNFSEEKQYKETLYYQSYSQPLSSGLRAITGALKNNRNSVSSKLSQLKRIHQENNKHDFRKEIYSLLEKGRIVVVDMSGVSKSDKMAAELSSYLTTFIVDKRSESFIKNESTKDKPIQIYLEEAHNLFQSGGDDVSVNVWMRLAKEAAKYNIGMVYSTQNIGSTSNEVLSNTENMLVSHLTSPKEINLLTSHRKEFEIWEDSIMRCRSKGFMRVLTRDSRFCVPTQVHLFSDKTVSQIRKRLLSF